VAGDVMDCAVRHPGGRWMRISGGVSVLSPACADRFSDRVRQARRKCPQFRRPAIERFAGANLYAKFGSPLRRLRSRLAGGGCTILRPVPQQNGNAIHDGVFVAASGASKRNRGIFACSGEEGCPAGGADDPGEKFVQDAGEIPHRSSVSRMRLLDLGRAAGRIL
jgi:hypothetical protein